MKPVMDDLAQAQNERPAEHTAIVEPTTPLPWSLKHVAGDNFAVQAFDVRGMFGGKPHVYPIFNKDCSAIDGGLAFMAPEDAAYLVHACNAYPRLITALFANAQLWRYADDIALLRDLGELAPDLVNDSR